MTVIKANGFFTLDGNDKGIVTVVGTDTVQFADLLAEAPSGRCFATGTLLNLTPQPFYMKIQGLGTEESSFYIPAYAGIKLTKMPMQKLRVAVNGTIRLIALGFIVDPVPNDDETAIAMLNTNSGLFIESDAGRSYVYDTATHTDISTATTTTILDPTTGYTARVRSISIAVSDACTVIVKWADSASANDQIIRQLNFSGVGSYIIDLGDKGQHNPQGVDGLLELVSDGTETFDVDVLSCAD